jgi:hypothetical protein
MGVGFLLRGGIIFINIENIALKNVPSNSNEQLFLGDLKYFPSL